MALVYYCSLDGLIASIVLLICTSLWIKASAKLLNVNVNNGRWKCILRINSAITVHHCKKKIRKIYGKKLAVVVAGILP